MCANTEHFQVNYDIINYSNHASLLLFDVLSYNSHYEYCLLREVLVLNVQYKRCALRYCRQSALL